MTSSASLTLALGLAAWLPAPAGATAGSPVGAPVPLADSLVARVAESIAAHWGVPVDELALEWGRVPAGVSPAADASFRLAGRGLDGRWVVVFDAAGSATAIRVRAGTTEDIPVAARALTAGSRLAAEDIGAGRRRRWGPPHSRDLVTPSAGWQVRRALAAGDPLEWPAVVAPVWASAGDPVALVWSGDGVSVSLLGTALNAAGAGQPVRARVPGRAHAIAGRMTAPGVAAIEEGARR